MRTYEEVYEDLIAEQNIQIIASALLEVMNTLCKIEGCENRYICDLGDSLLHKYGKQLKDIADNEIKYGTDSSCYEMLHYERWCIKRT